MKKKLCLFVGIFCFCFGSVRLYYNLTDDFRSGNYLHEVPFHSEWKNAPLSSNEQTQLDSILSQKFFYIDKGAQSFVFLSQDGKHVLKLFKFKHLKPSLLFELLPSLGPLKTIKEDEKTRKYLKLESVFNGYHLAYDKHKKDSGLLYVHLNKGGFSGKKIQVKDKMGIWHELELDQLIYVLQEKAVTTRKEMVRLLSSGNVAAAIERVNQIFDLYLREYAKGIYDRDHGVMHNTGFVHGSTIYPIHLDIGKFSSEPSMRDVKVFRPDLLKIVNKFDLWFKENYPQNYPELLHAMEKRLSIIFGEEFLLHS